MYKQIILFILFFEDLLKYLLLFFRDVKKKYSSKNIAIYLIIKKFKFVTQIYFIFLTLIIWIIK